MIWASWAVFFAMGGYGFYVWGSYLLALVFISGETLLVLNRQRISLKNIGRIQGQTRQGNNETPT